jgi:hypothetical protein
MSKIPKSGVKKTEEVVGAMEARTLPQVAVEVIKSALAKVPGLRDVNGHECPDCRKLGKSAITKAGHSGSVTTYYYCPNRPTGCRYSHQVTRPGVIERMNLKARGESVKTPIRDGGNLGGLESIE